MNTSLMPLISSDTTFQPGVRQMEQCELERALERLHPESWGWALACCGREKEMPEAQLSLVIRIKNLLTEKQQAQLAALRRPRTGE